MPFMIFVDLNSPPTPSLGITEKQWFKDINNLIARNYGIPTLENPDSFNAIVFTNYSYHYQTEREAEPGERLSLISQYPKYPLPNNEFLPMLESALTHYGRVPNIDLEDRPLL